MQLEVKNHLQKGLQDGAGPSGKEGSEIVVDARKAAKVSPWAKLINQLKAMKPENLLKKFMRGDQLELSLGIRDGRWK